jgi:polysaccharide biosynthesis protein PslG
MTPSRAALRPLGLAVCAALALSTGLAAQPDDADAAPPRAPKTFYGIAPATYLDASEWERLGRAKVGTLRWPFLWPQLQPDPPGREGFDASIRWEELDPLVREAAAQGIQIQAFVYGSPDWIADSYKKPPLGARERIAWQAMLRALIERYGPDGDFWASEPDLPYVPITAWQVWNEPNSPTFWKPIRTGPERYAELLKLSARTIRRADPNAQVVSAGLFFSPGGGMRMPPFMKRFYEVKGITRSFDVLGMHPYGSGLKALRDQMDITRRRMKQGDDSGTPVWITELGWPTGGDKTNPFYKTYAQQAHLLERSFEIIRERRDWKVRKLIWYTWRDNHVNPICFLCQYSGLFDIDGNPKPSWRSFVEFTGGTP